VKSSGSRLGPYEIHSSIGAGGMGEVYRARDTRLDRIVAIKVIASTVALDPAFRERFDREARAISALDHPHICTLYDVGHENGVDFLVMQFLEGETLAARLARGPRPRSDAASGGAAATLPSLTSVARGPVPVETALRYGAEIASALDAAHRRGIVHRDLKPGNVMLTKSGTKLLDFGLAKLAEETPAGGLGGPATRTVPLTSSGSIVGTLNYMPPEQLEGGTIDARTDIFALGAVLFEMLSGRRAFDAESHAGLIAAILNDDPPALGELADTRSSLPPSLHRALERLVRRCLAQDPDDRWQSAADVAAELRWIDEERARAAGRTENDTSANALAPRSGKRKWPLLSGAALAFVALVGAAAWFAPRPEPSAEVVTFDLSEADTPNQFNSGPGMMAVSPDGRHVVMSIGSTRETAVLVIRSLRSTTTVTLKGTEGAWQPFWSPDSRSIGFIDGAREGNVRRVDVEGGRLTTLAEKVRGRGAWGSSGLVLVDRALDGIFSVSENGGTLTRVTTVNTAAGETDHLWPVFLPDGRRFLYMVRYPLADRHKNTIVLASVDSAERQEILKASSHVELSAGHLLFSRDGTVYAQPFDADKGRLTGEARPIAEGIAQNLTNGRAAFSAAAAATTLVYRRGGADGRLHNTMEWFDRAGKSLGILGGTESRNRGHALSPDGTRVAVMRDEPDGRIDLYLIDVERNITSRLTSDPGDDMFPVWSPDGARIYFTRSNKGSLDLFQRSSGNAGGDELLLESPLLKAASAVSPDGKILLFTTSRDGLRNGRDIWGLPLTGEKKPFVVRQTRYEEEAASFSPDGKWIVYHANDLGTWQVYVESFPVAGERVRISSPSGSNAGWSRDGRTIFYLSSDRNLMAVDLTVSGEKLRPAAARELFALDRLTEGPGVLDIDHGRGRFLLNTRGGANAESTRVPPLTIITNWVADAASRSRNAS
jgi:serine/threonine protein kinase/Tol biopolymer transport system component